MPHPSPIRVFAPASVSNVACGFDTLGFAIEGMGDSLLVRAASEAEIAAARSTGGGGDGGGGGGVRIKRITGDGGVLPFDPERNTATVAAAAVIDRFLEAGHGSLSRSSLSLILELDKRMPLSSGLGSSAASAVAGAFGAYQYLRRVRPFELDESELIECALAGELVASGGRHADNVAPCLLGGFVLVRSLDGTPDVVRLPDCRSWLWCALAKPEIAIDTLGSRQRLGDTVALAAAIRQWANVGALVAALYQRDAELLSRALEDHIAEPSRHTEVAGFRAAMDAAKAAGALGGSLSGSGPTLFALATSPEAAEASAVAMTEALLAAGHSHCESSVTPVGAEGARLEAVEKGPGESATIEAAPP